MIVNLRDSKARLSELVEFASKGEDVLITVRGKIRARLTRANDFEPADMKCWAQELGEHLTAQKPNSKSINEWLESDREDRL